MHEHTKQWQNDVSQLYIADHVRERVRNDRGVNGLIRKRRKRGKSVENYVISEPPSTLMGGYEVQPHKVYMPNELDLHRLSF